MSTRRTFLKQTAAAGALAATSVQIARATAGGVDVKSVIRREDTILRLGGMGDNFHMTWAADGPQYVSLCDGYAWDENPAGHWYNSRLLAIDGGPRDATIRDVPGYPELKPSDDKDARYYNFGTLALDGNIYQFLSTPNYAWGLPDARFTGVKLIYSPDNGRTWRNQDGSTPVTWEAQERRSRDNMIFFEESQSAFALLSVLQMGRNYEANRDGYVYVYSPNGSADGTMNELVMARAPKTRILDRSAYEFFAGPQGNGGAAWVKDIDARKAVYTFPRGWVNKTLHPWAWMPSVIYNAPLRQYMMTSWGTATAPDGTWFAKPSYLGFWMAPNPWGPWRQVHEETAWLPGNDSQARAFAPQISPKWVGRDGKSFWLVWSDYQGAPDLDRELAGRTEEMKRMNDGEKARAVVQIARRYMPYYAFNTQRVDLVIA